jgi:hypothetical protein
MTYPATTKIKPDGLALAGLANDKPMLLAIARLLLADLYWDDENEALYRAGGGQEKCLEKRPETPEVPDETDALIRMAALTGRIEQAWGESFYSIARRICPPDVVPQSVHSDLMYHTIMGCIGHGINAADMEIAQFPEELDTAPIRIENPMLFQLSLLDAAELDRS